ncbi:MAG TPA: methyltransferase domain-containing protein [Pseudonocardiaceae bacterium]|jgi:ubiquinone/menaquinone biosynthesis C-methylase UbiE|nr:methyltransferase domain-containing protein [Pseudonocardiaceae bacterium]
MSIPQLDSLAVKEDIRASWNAISSGWEAVQDTFERGAASMTTRLLDLGGVREGQAVLDVATGLGEPALTAADRVGPAGRVVGVDIAAGMVEGARRRARNRENVEFLVADLESIDLPPKTFDVVLSRWGLMFAVDHVAAFRTVARLLVPGGVLAASVWSEPQRAPMMSTGYAVLAQRLDMPPPPPGLPGPFSMSDPGQLTEELTEAGFTEIVVDEFVVPFRLASAQEYAEFNKAVSPPKLRQRLAELDPEQEAETWARVGAAVERYRSAGGDLFLPSTALCVRAVAPETSD